MCILSLPASTSVLVSLVYVFLQNTKDTVTQLKETIIAKEQHVYVQLRALECLNVSLSAWKQNTMIK